MPVMLLVYTNEASKGSFYVSAGWNHTMVGSIHQSEQIYLQEGIWVKNYLQGIFRVKRRSTTKGDLLD